MTRLTTLAVAMLASIGTALGQVSQPTRDLISKLNSEEIPSRLYGSPALEQLMVVLRAPTRPLSSLPTPLAKKTVLRDEFGGRLDQHRARFAAYNASGDDVEIRGVCHSACTLIMGIVPRDRICFSSLGFLSFHKASHADGTMSWDDTLAMVSSYPTDIQRWLQSKGGPADLPHKVRSPWDAWVLAAPDLWKMGYRKCD